MENALLVGLSRQVALGRELDVIANNLANVSTTGFKARSSRFAEYLMPQARADAFPSQDRGIAFVVDGGMPLDVTSGPIERTGNPLDVAVKGEGFLVVQTPGGERYTRSGAMQIDPTGRLVTNDGYPVMGDAGPVVFGPREAHVAIAADGTVTSDQGARGKLRLVSFANPHMLKSEGANVYSAAAQPTPAGTAASLEPGSLERSNVKPVVEMTRLMEVQRSYTGVANMIGRMDEMKRSTLSKLADVA
ncbi:flagellar basal-body rod protein FlgF [Enterovirga rhinocerotis]|uniref:Flagellar basal-body rod protein FlgF n=1 Tax=Enterovirga rhinocerotis TaxID=1339210 RepID=A0A4R7BY17_9HYPH|nr:flagellar basal-body rod protein FlgF [Enterovirga rhinocerotis]TDR88906.1 flagellar basal-body rod protein FlgF [Enterovirga rhinocerotis]